MQKRNVNTLAYINQTKDICNPLNKLKNLETPVKPFNPFKPIYYKIK